jgi:hypothetical protein
MVKMNNLCTLKDGVGPCLEDTNNIYPFMASFNIKYNIYSVDLETIKVSAGRGAFLSRRHIIEPPVRNKNKEQEANHSSPL